MKTARTSQAVWIALRFFYLLRRFSCLFPPSTIVSNVISKPNKILPFKSLSLFFYNVSSIIVKLCSVMGVIANWHAKKGIYMSSSSLSPFWARMTANLLVEILLNSSNKILFSASVMFSITVPKLLLSQPI